MSESKDLISVIVPVYNTEQYLVRCVESIRSQTYSRLEIILVDDGSPDNAGVLCDRLKATDERIKVIHKSNGGLGDARNAGIENSNGEYFAFVDSDDTLEPDAFEVLLDNMLKYGAEISCCGINNVLPDGRIYYTNEKTELLEVFDSHQALSNLLDNTVITNSACDKLYKKEIFDNLRFAHVVYEDFQLQPYCLLKAEKIVYTGKPMYNYYKSPVSLLRGCFSPRRFDFLEICRSHIKLYSNACPESLPALINMYYEMGLYFIYMSYNRRDCKTARENTVKLFRSIPKEHIRCIAKNNLLKLFMLKISDKLYITVYDAFRKRHPERYERI